MEQDKINPSVNTSLSTGEGRGEADALSTRLMQKNERLYRFIRKEIEHLAERESELTLGDVEESLLRVRWETEEALTEAFFGKEKV